MRGVRHAAAAARGGGSPTLRLPCVMFSPAPPSSACPRDEAARSAAT